MNINASLPMATHANMSKNPKFGTVYILPTSFSDSFTLQSKEHKAYALARVEEFFTESGHPLPEPEYVLDNEFRPTRVVDGEDVEKLNRILDTYLSHERQPEMMLDAIERLSKQNGVNVVDLNQQ